jgi:hypothetical protein
MRRSSPECPLLVTRQLTNSAALLMVQKLVSEFREASMANLSDEQIRELLYGRVVEWSLVRQLAPIAELVVKAWLEQSPNSPLARAAVVDQLYVIGRPEEAVAVEEGGQPTPIDETSEENLAWSRCNAERTSNF